MRNVVRITRNTLDAVDAILKLRAEPGISRPSNTNWKPSTFGL